MAKPRFFIDNDDDGHWYIIPVKFRDQWNEWMAQDWRNELADFQLPDFVVDIEGPDALTFTDPLTE